MKKRILKIKRLCCLIMVCVVAFTSVDVYAAITVGGSAPGKYQENGDCSYKDRNSAVIFVEEFMDEITYDPLFGSPVATKKFLYKNNYAWEQDMKPGQYSNDSIDDVNFMIYCGHGLAKGKEGLPNNSLHYYTCNSSSKFHNSKNESAGSSNLTTAEARWGKSGTQTRWVALFTCNFLNSKDSQCGMMMQGLRVCMGFGTTMWIDSREGEKFGEDLYDGKKMIDAFLDGASMYQSGKIDGGVEAKAIYTPSTRNDTINSSTARQEPIGGDTSYFVVTRYIP